MAMNIVIDWGNSRVKAAVFSDDKLIETKIFPEEDIITALSFYIQDHKITNGILASVAMHPPGLETMLQGNLKYFVRLDMNTPLPIINAYTSPDTLGMDRLPLAVGAYMTNPDKNNLVISCGTCITYNFIQKNRTFRGGAISPGLHMRLQAMHQFTEKLPQVKVEGDLVLLGFDTATCMRSGAVFGMASEIDGMVAEFAAQYPDFNATLTGGDAPYFESRLKSKIFADPYLSLRGLNLILKHNVPHTR